MENRYDNNAQEEKQGWGAYATPPPISGLQNKFRAETTADNAPLTLCARVRDMLPPLIENDGELRPEMAQAVYTHLATCPGCAREFDEMQRVVKLVENLAPVEMPMDFSGLIMQRIYMDIEPEQQTSHPLSAQNLTSENAFEEVAVRTRSEKSTETVQTVPVHSVQVVQTTSSAQTVTAIQSMNLWQRLAMVACGFVMLLAVLTRSGGHQALGVNFETAQNWLFQIESTLNEVPLLGWIVSNAFGALLKSGVLIQQSFSTLGANAMRGFVFDLVLCVAAYYYVTRRQLPRRVGY